MQDPKATVRLAEDTLRAFKSETARKGETIQEVLERAVVKYLKAVKAKF